MIRFCTTKTAQTPNAPYRYFGLESGRDCRCGNTFKHATAPGTCTSRCTGNQSQRCGGANSLDVWQNEDWSPVSQLLL
jgi:hypothetical protein